MYDPFSKNVDQKLGEPCIHLPKMLYVPRKLDGRFEARFVYEVLRMRARDAQHTACSAFAECSSWEGDGPA